MQDIPLTQILVLLAFILVPLINLLLKRMRRRFEPPPRREPPRQPAPRTIGKLPPVEVVASARERVPAPARTQIPPRSRPPLRNRALFSSRRDLRRAILLMAVLGPCRALDAPEAERRQFPSGS
jgi:hypothetical protein